MAPQNLLLYGHLSQNQDPHRCTFSLVHGRQPVPHPNYTFLAHSQISEASTARTSLCGHFCAFSGTSRLFSFNNWRFSSRKGPIPSRLGLKLEPDRPGCHVRGVLTSACRLCGVLRTRQWRACPPTKHHPDTTDGHILHGHILPHTRTHARTFPHYSPRPALKPHCSATLPDHFYAATLSCTFLHFLRIFRKRQESPDYAGLRGGVRIKVSNLKMVQALPRSVATFRALSQL